MPDSILSTYPVDFERTAIAVAYSNAAYVADEVLPRRAVARKEYRYTEYPLAESFTVPDTRIGRRSAPAMVHFSATEKAGACTDYGLEDAIPDDDVANAPPSAADPVDRSTMRLTDLLMIDREQRTAQLVFDKTRYGAANKVTLSGDDQWSADHADSDPIADLTGAMESMVAPPTHLLMGSEVWLALRTHKTVLKALHRTDGDAGIASRRAVADLFELEGIVVGRAWVNSKAPGQAAVLRRIWGKSALLYRRDPNADVNGPPTLGVTAEYRGRETRTGFDAALGARGSHRIRVVDTCEERLIAPLAGYLLDQAVA